MVFNKGTYAGGANPNIFGKAFEDKTCMKKTLCDIGFKLKKMNDSKYGYYLKRKENNTKIIYFTQSGVKTYFKRKFSITLYRNPDEAYLIITKDNKFLLKILEKKEQHREGSVETKLWAGPSLKREYEIVLGDKFTVDYAYSVNNFLTNKFNSGCEKYEILKKILDENKITIFYANEKNYRQKIIYWVNMF